MSRLIDADALMALINNSVFTADMTTTLAVNMAARWIENAPTIEPEPQWVPCSERLPEHELVLVQFSDGDFSLLQFPTVYRRKDMVAWMPLPEPYKENV